MIHSAALQSAIYAHLTSYQPLLDLVETHIYDSVPSGALPLQFVLIGDEQVRDRSDKTRQAWRHELTISVISSEAGFVYAKAIASEIAAALSDATLSITGADLRALELKSTRTKRNAGGFDRRIDLIFHAYLDAI